VSITLRYHNRVFRVTCSQDRQSPERPLWVATITEFDPGGTTRIMWADMAPHHTERAQAAMLAIQHIIDTVDVAVTAQPGWSITKRVRGRADPDLVR
jgi:hypothetical protein